MKRRLFNFLIGTIWVLMADATWADHRLSDAGRSLTDRFIQQAQNDALQIYGVADGALAFEQILALPTIRVDRELLPSALNRLRSISALVRLKPNSKSLKQELGLAYAELEMLGYVRPESLRVNILLISNFREAIRDLIRFGEEKEFILAFLSAVAVSTYASDELKIPTLNGLIALEQSHPPLVEMLKNLVYQNSGRPNLSPVFREDINAARRMLAYAQGTRCEVYVKRRRDRLFAVTTD